MRPVSLPLPYLWVRVDMAIIHIKCESDKTAAADLF